MSAKWDDSLLRRLEILAEQHLSAAQIAARLGLRRNAVIGKAWRLGIGLSGRPGKPVSSGRPRPPAARPAAKKTKPVESMPISRPAAAAALPAAHVQPPRQALGEGQTSPLDLAFELLEFGQCRWPSGSLETGDLRFCAQPACEGGSYCGRHRRLAYVKGTAPRHRDLAAWSGAPVPQHSYPAGAGRCSVDE